MESYTMKNGCIVETFDTTIKGKRYSQKKLMDLVKQGIYFQKEMVERNIYRKDELSKVRVNRNNTFSVLGTNAIDYNS